MDEATSHHHTFLCHQIYTISENQEREEAHTGDITDDSIATGQERRTRLYNRFFLLKKNNRDEAATEIVNWTISKRVEDYSDK